MAGTASIGANQRIDSQRLWDSLMEMAKIGPGIAGGNNRQTLTDADSEGRHLFKRWCEGAGMTMGVDSMGTMFATRAGTEDLPPVYMGSHLDTQPTGGKYDGVLGVLGALEVVRTMNDLGIRTRHPVVVTNWTNEEGARFAPAMLASGRVRGGSYRGVCQGPDGPGGQGLRRGTEADRLGRRRKGRRAEDPRDVRAAYRTGARFWRPRGKRSASSRMARGCGGWRSR